MAGSVARFPDPSAGNGDGISPTDLYRMAVEEYRWQAGHNWTRTQYFLAFDAAILATGATMASQRLLGSILVFGLGFVSSVLSAGAVRTQHDYYRAARRRMQRLEERFNIIDRVDTTATLGKRPRAVSVNQVVYLLLATLALANLAGILVVWSPWS